jgi:uncharacterized RmlC-like cupin family protein
MWYGENLEHHMQINPGDFLYIPGDMPHLPYNPSATEPCIALIEQESVVLLSHLDEIVRIPAESQQG